MVGLIPLCTASCCTHLACAPKKNHNALFVSGTVGSLDKTQGSTEVLLMILGVVGGVFDDSLFAAGERRLFSQTSV